jgi:hypothetical protein
MALTQYNISTAGFVVCNNACDSTVVVDQLVWANAASESLLVGQQLYTDSGGTIPWGGGTNTYHRISIVGGSGFGYSATVSLGGVVIDVLQCISVAPGQCDVLPTPTVTPTQTPTPTGTAAPIVFPCNDCRNWQYNNVPVGGDVIYYYRCDDGVLQTIVVSELDTGNFCNCNNIGNPYTDNGTQLTEVGICVTPTPTTTPTPTVTPTVTSTQTPTPTPTITPTQTITNTPTITPTNTLTPTITPTNTVTPSVTPTQGLSPTPTPTLTTTPTPSSSAPIPSQTPTPSPTMTPFPTPVYVLKNDCNVFTLFPLGLECVTVAQPSSEVSVDGVLAINITGGTGPYSISWSNGQTNRTLGGLKQGSYEVTVTDFYGDFTSSTICSLFAPSPTPTNTPTVTPTPSVASTYPNLCLIIQSTPTTNYPPIQFVYSGFINGKPSWTSGSYTMKWTGTRWQVDGYTISNGILVSTTTTTIPTSNWTIVGSTLSPVPVVSVTQGTCPAVAPLNFTTTTSPSDCTNNGSITVTAFGGYPPYFYSNDGGTTFRTSPVFNNLLPQTYYIIVRDSSGTTYNTTQVVPPLSNTTFQTYSISVVNYLEDTITVGFKRAYWKVNVTPSLPVGTNLNFKLNVQSIQNINGPGSGITTNLTQVISGGTLATSSSQTTGTTTSVRTNCSPYTTEQNTSVVTYNLTSISGQTISGVTNSNLTITSGMVETNGCVTNVEQTIRVYVTEATITGCNCCLVNLDSNATGGITNHSISFGQGQNTQLYYPVVLGLGTSPAGACTDYGSGITRLINSPTFEIGVTVLVGSPRNPQVASGFSNVVYNGTVYELTNGVVTSNTGVLC